MGILSLKWGRLLRSAIVAAIVVPALSLPFFRAPLDIANGYAASWLTASDSFGDEVILLSADDDRDPPPVLIQALAELRPRIILPVVVNADRADELAAIGTVLVRPIVQLANAPTVEGNFGVLPETSRGYGFFRPIGPATLPRNLRPLSFDSVALAGMGITPPPAYWTGYLPDSRSMPIYEARGVLDGEIPPRFVEGKTVIVAAAANAPVPVLWRQPRSDSVSPPLMVANAVQAVIDGRIARVTPVPVTLFLTFLSAFEAGLILTRLRDRAGPLLLPLAIVVLAVLTVLVHVVSGVMFPLAEALVAFVFAWVVHRVILDINRRRRQRRQLRDLFLATRLSPVKEPLTKTDWCQRVEDTARTLGFTDYSLFISRRGRYKEVAASDPPLVRFPRATVRRALARIRHGAQRRVLTPLPPESDPRAAPSNEIWAARVWSRRSGWAIMIGVCAEDTMSSSPSRRAAMLSSLEQLLAAYPQKHRLTQLATLDEEIAGQSRLLSNDAETLSLLVHLASSAFAIYDLTGGFIRQNERMYDIAATRGFLLNGMSLLETVEALTGGSQRDAIEIVSSLISNREAQTIRLPQGPDGRDYSMRLFLDAEDPLGADEHGQVGAILVELNDMTAATRLAKARHSVASFFDQQLRNDFEAIELVAGMLMDQSLTSDMRSKVYTQFERVKDRMLSRMEDFETAIGDISNRNTVTAHPVEFIRLLEEAIEASSRHVQHKSVDLVIDLPRLISLVIASPTELREVLIEILRFAIFDVRSGAQIKVTVRELPATIEANFETDDTALPTRLVAETLAGTARDVPPELLGLRHSKEFIEEWGGQLSLSPLESGGLEISISLRKVC